MVPGQAPATTERYAFIERQGERLFVGWHLPADWPEVASVSPPAPLSPQSSAREERGRGWGGACAILVSPIHEEKKATHRPLVDLARALAARGVPCIRFDYRGSGDSTGDPARLTLSAMCEDLRSAMAEAIAVCGTTRFALVGLRLGADAAAIVAEENPAIERLVLVAPLGKGARYVGQARLRSRIRGALTGPEDEGPRPEGEGGFDYDGHILSAAAVAELEAHDLAARTGRIPARVLCLDLCAKEKPTAVLEGLAEALRARATSVALRAIVEEPFWNALGPVEPRAFLSTVAEELLGPTE